MTLDHPFTKIIQPPYLFNEELFSSINQNETLVLNDEFPNARLYEFLFQFHTNISE